MSRRTSIVIRPKGLDLGTLQSDFATARSHLKASESALLRAHMAPIVQGSILDQIQTIVCK